MSDERAAFIWGNTGPNSLIKLGQFVANAIEGCCEIKIWGPPDLHDLWPDYYVDIATPDNLNWQCFNYSYGYLKGPQGRIRIIIDDYSYGNGTPGISFNFCDANPTNKILYTLLKYWLDSLICLQCTVVIRGKNSHLALDPLSRDDRLTIASTSIDLPGIDDDKFYIPLNGSYEDIRGYFQEALTRFPGQTPQIDPSYP